MAAVVPDPGRQGRGLPLELFLWMQDIHRFSGLWSWCVAGSIRLQEASSKASWHSQQVTTLVRDIWVNLFSEDFLPNTAILPNVRDCSELPWPRPRYRFVHSGLMRAARTLHYAIHRPLFLSSFLPGFFASLLPCFLAFLLPCFLASLLPCFLSFLSLSFFVSIFLPFTPSFSLSVVVFLFPSSSPGPISLMYLSISSSYYRPVYWL